MGKKRHKYDDYVDLGAGYDENDSFIDNTDAVSVIHICYTGNNMIEILRFFCFFFCLI